MVERVHNQEISSEPMIHDSKYDVFGKRFATCSSDGKIEIYDCGEDGKMTRAATIPASNGPVWRISWADPRFGNYIASCGFDKLIKIWKEVKPNDWVEDYCFSGHTSSVNCVVFGPWELDLKLAACSSDATISIHIKENDKWVDKQCTRAHLGPINAISWAPASTFNHLLENKRQAVQKLVSCSCDKKLIIWEFNNAVIFIQLFKLLLKITKCLKF